MWRDKTVSVIFPTDGEKNSIRAATIDFLEAGMVDEIIVVNNDSPGISEELRGTGARVLFESQAGYGNAALCGIDNCDSDIIVLAKPDGSFNGGDLLKLLAYSDDFPVVLGTRVASMGRFRRWGNGVAAKMAELLFSTTVLTDSGCPYRVFSCEALRRIRPHLNAAGSHFSSQALMEVIAHKIPFIEIPVRYRRVAADGLWMDFKLGMRTIATVLHYRLGLCRAPRNLWDEAGLREFRQNAATPSAGR